MRKILPAFFLIFFSLYSFGQNSIWKRPKYLAKIEDKSENFILTGALYNITDSSVILTCSTCNAAETERFQILISIQKVDEIIIKRNSHFVNWLMAGTVSGISGFFYAYSKYKEFKGIGSEFSGPYPAYLATFTAIGALPFIIIGIFRSSSSETLVKIDKEQQKFFSNKEVLKKYCFIQ